MAAKTLWELLWDYDPNGLVVVDTDMRIKVVNPSFCTMFRCREVDILGQDAGSLLGDMADFREAWEGNKVITGKEQAYPSYNLYVREVIFPIREEGIIGCIVVDLSHDWHQQQELHQLKQQTLEKVSQVVNKQMKVAQEIAELLGETTAETKVSLLKLREILEQES